MINEDVFERHLCERCDEIHNSVHHMLCEISGKHDLEWDMSLIGEIADIAAEVLNDHGIECCYPAFVSNSDDYTNESLPCANLSKCPLGIQKCVLKDDSSNPAQHENDEDLVEDEPSDEPIRKPTYDYVVCISDSCDFGFRDYSEAEEFANQYKSLMRSAGRNPSCVIYVYDKDSDSYVECRPAEE